MRDIALQELEEWIARKWDPSSMLSLKVYTTQRADFYIGEFVYHDRRNPVTATKSVRLGVRADRLHETPLSQSTIRLTKSKLVLKRPQKKAQYGIKSNPDGDREVRPR